MGKTGDLSRAFKEAIKEWLAKMSRDKRKLLVNSKRRREHKEAKQRKRKFKRRKIDPDVQVCVLDYRPEFRNLQISRPTFEEMVTVWKMLRSTGLRIVICQTVDGYIGPHKPSFSHR